MIEIICPIAIMFLFVFLTRAALREESGCDVCGSPSSGALCTECSERREKTTVISRAELAERPLLNTAEMEPYRADGEEQTIGTTSITNAFSDGDRALAARRPRPRGDRVFVPFVAPGCEVIPYTLFDTVTVVNGDVSVPFFMYPVGTWNVHQYGKRRKTWAHTNLRRSNCIPRPQRFRAESLLVFCREHYFLQAIDDASFEFMVNGKLYVNQPLESVLQVGDLPDFDKATDLCTPFLQGAEQRWEGLIIEPEVMIEAALRWPDRIGVSIPRNMRVKLYLTGMLAKEIT